MKKCLAIVIALCLCLMNGAALAERGWTFSVGDIVAAVNGEAVRLKPTLNVEAVLSDDYAEAYLTLTPRVGKKALTALRVQLTDAGAAFAAAGQKANALLQGADRLDGLFSDLLDEDIAYADALEEIDIALMLGEAPIALGEWEALDDGAYCLSFTLGDTRVTCRVDAVEIEESQPFSLSKAKAVACDDLSGVANTLVEPMKGALHALFNDDSVWYLVNALAGN